ncbi:hypothetical protein HNR07_001023 [Nocardiopsis metallicus]|uniref:Uncharacterized protein n=1 Tax=Nocardiopsis metallicus TaxID=179819 RepID=A0A840WEX1_9ACTN|nr:hypothetical protein [Nocardiopsis metallicus]
MGHLILGSTLAFSASSFNRPAIWRGVRPRPRSARTRSRTIASVSMRRCWGRDRRVLARWWAVVAR